ncbi:LADA_0D01442g1_1 [Lachancea dasiensis]|uniref:triacylglycerol lipase n=1 Tax=Lachancea dasiensis TaxID=1072105 RepID=A0A1G4J3T3_9SACH|nr:LADA_0D01442g1_1 [Lachancea dasiensis]
MKVAQRMIVGAFFGLLGICERVDIANKAENHSLSQFPRFGDIDMTGATAGKDRNSHTQDNLDGTISIIPAASEHYVGVRISDELYERLVYFSKMCALTYCITSNEIIDGSTFTDGGCPARLNFCSDKQSNPTAADTKIELVLLAQGKELGTGFLAVDHEKEVVILSFRGSSTNQDWLSDFAIYPTPYEPASKEFYDEWVASGRIGPCEDCMLHRGFNVFLNTLSSKFFEKIESIFETHPGYELVVIGHSLGAAVASLAGIELRLRGYEPLVLTYASPKIFSSKLRAWVDELFETDEIHERSLREEKVMFRQGFFRVVHDEDYITMVPPFYEPAGLEIFINYPHLPPRREHLEYHGPSNNLVSVDTQSLFSTTGRGQGHRLLGPLETWLHMYEHRAYFILINTCDGF